MSYGANAYARVSQTALTPREAEAAVLIKAARRLQAIQADWPNQAGSLSEALHFNQKVWTLISGSAMEESNPIPEAIKQNVGRLAMFVLHSSIDTMIEPTAKKIEQLISINHNIAAGLQGNPGA